MEVLNTIPGELSQFKNGLIPDSFESDILTNYTVEVLPVNYAQNMNIIVYLPGGLNETSQIKLPSEEEGLKCYGLAGTDNAGSENTTLECTVNYEERFINITNAVTYSRGNPGAIRMIFSMLRNPVENIVTESFKIETETSDGWKLDTIASNVTVNFYCKYPCASCNIDEPDVCLSCYSSADERFFFDAKCYDICPAGFVNTTTNNCTACEAPCATCVDTIDYCLSCVEDYKLMEGGGRCREIVLWPFPYLCFSIAAFLVILISEIVTKGESRFKETFIAALSLPEFFSWINLLVFMWYRIG
jgi:hypothetical protein